MIYKNIAASYFRKQNFHLSLTAMDSTAVLEPYIESNRVGLASSLVWCVAFAKVQHSAFYFCCIGFGVLSLELVQLHTVAFLQEAYFQCCTPPYFK